MSQIACPIEVYLEASRVRTFAGALDWPGWCRSGHDEASALQALMDYGPRYAKALQETQLEFHPPASVTNLVVGERLMGNTTTDYGAPAIALSTDSLPMDAEELDRSQIILEACWKALDNAMRSANGRELHKGPRGGGRDLMRIGEHVRDAEIAYLGSLGGKFKPEAENGPRQIIAMLRREILITLAASARGEIPPRGPRGGLRWSPRYFVRRLAWHDLDHAWEIEDRAE